MTRAIGRSGRALLVYFVVMLGFGLGISDATDWVARSVSAAT